MWKPRRRRAIAPWRARPALSPEEVREFQDAWESSFSQAPARPVPAFAPRHTYGGKGTIHHTTTVDVQVDPATGEVHAVWFRRLQLPFTVSEVRNDISSNPLRNMAIEEITYVDLPAEAAPDEP